MTVTTISTLDAILDLHRAEIGADFVPYRNHAFRIANLCLAGVPASPDTFEKAAVTAAFHDLGIWTDRTFDYLEPSVRAATGWLAANGRSDWTAEIAEAIRQHHKVTAWRGGGLVEAFRRADWADVTWGLVANGLPRSVVRGLYGTWPDAGFHRLLVRLELAHLRRHPLNPIPVLRW